LRGWFTTLSQTWAVNGCVTRLGVFAIDWLCFIATCTSSSWEAMAKEAFSEPECCGRPKIYCIKSRPRQLHNASLTAHRKTWWHRRESSTPFTPPRERMRFSPSCARPFISHQHSWGQFQFHCVQESFINWELLTFPQMHFFIIYPTLGKAYRNKPTFKAETFIEIRGKISSLWIEPFWLITLNSRYHPTEHHNYGIFKLADILCVWVIDKYI
jgi:hypothetical protein